VQLPFLSPVVSFEKFCNIDQRGSGQGHTVLAEQHENADAACLTSPVFKSPF
jgi:hypothetical protein